MPKVDKTQLKGKDAKAGLKDSTKVKKGHITTAGESTSIDDIFAGGSSSKSKPSTGTSSSTPLPSTKNKSKTTSTPSTSTSNDPLTKAKTKTKQRPREIRDNTDSSSSKRVIEIVDPSIAPPPPAPMIVPSISGKTKKRDKKDVEDDEMFKDSRGTGPRRKTEEGFLIFKEAELGIDPEAGGTPLCPFDCDCCF